MNKYNVGDKVRVIEMTDPVPMPVGSIGTIRHIVQLGTGFILSMRWDNPDRSLNLLDPEDKFEVLSNV